MYIHTYIQMYDTHICNHINGDTLLSCMMILIVYACIRAMMMMMYVYVCACV